MNRDANRGGAETTIEANDGGSLVDISFVQASDVPTWVKTNRGPNRGEPTTMSKANIGGSPAEVSFIQAFANLLRTETFTEANRGESRLDASLDRDSEDWLWDETNRGRSRAAMAYVVRDASGILLNGFSKTIEASSPKQAETVALVETLIFLLPRSIKNLQLEYDCSVLCPLC